MQRDSSSTAGNAAALVQPAITVTSQQREPPVFTGLRGDDVEEWLDHYNRVSSFNRWDDAYKRKSIGFYLSEVADTWFRNHEDVIPDWSSFVEQLLQIFGTSSARSDGAKKKLDARIQRPDETYASYIEDVVALCRRVNKDMSETDKVRHIMKGIASFAFNALAVHNPTTVADVRTICQRLDQLQSTRLQQDNWSAGSFSDSELRTLIRTIIREELQQRDAACSSHNTQVHAHGLREIIKEELACMTDIPQPCRSAPLHVQSYSEAVSRPHLPVEPIGPPTAHCQLTAISAPSPPSPSFSAWRAMRPTRDRPVCYYCGIRGHISRFCRRRQLDERRGYAPYERDNYFGYAPRQRMYSPPPRRSSPPPDAMTPPPTSRSARRRSPSPFRRALSPLRPVSVAPNQHQEN